MTIIFNLFSTYFNEIELSDFFGQLINECHSTHSRQISIIKEIFVNLAKVSFIVDIEYKRKICL